MLQTDQALQACNDYVHEGLVHKTKNTCRWVGAQNKKDMQVGGCAKQTIYAGGWVRKPKTCTCIGAQTKQKHLQKCANQKHAPAQVNNNRVHRHGLSKPPVTMWSPRRIALGGFQRLCCGHCRPAMTMCTGGKCIKPKYMQMGGCAKPKIYASGWVRKTKKS